MYLGRIVEEASSAEIFTRPSHPHTQLLREDMPCIDPDHREFSLIEGELPSPLTPLSGCHFRPRCSHAMSRCTTEAPITRIVALGHASACHLNDQASLPVLASG